MLLIFYCICGNLNGNGPYELIHCNIWSLDGGNVWTGLLEEVCHSGRALRFPETCTMPSVPPLCLLFEEQDVSSQLFLSPCLCSVIMDANPLQLEAKFNAEF